MKSLASYGLNDDHYRRGICKRCGVVMNDIEPLCAEPEFWHPMKTDCPNSRRYGAIPREEWTWYMRKRYRRARKRGARAAARSR